MAGNNNDTSTPNDGTQDPAASGSPDAAGAASDAGPDEVSVLRSRYAGQTAKVNELTNANKAHAERIKELEKQLADARGGVMQADEAAKALVTAKDEELKALRREASLTRIEAKYPETYRELGEDAAGLSEEKLAAMEARLKGVAQGQEPPTPRGQSASRGNGVPTGGREPREQTVDDIVATMRTMELPDWLGGKG